MWWLLVIYKLKVLSVGLTGMGLRRSGNPLKLGAKRGLGCKCAFLEESELSWVLKGVHGLKTIKNHVEMQPKCHKESEDSSVCSRADRAALEQTEHLSTGKSMEPEE